MLFKLSLRFWRINSIGLVILSLAISASALQQQSEASLREKRWRPERPAIGLEIISPHKPAPLFKGSASEFVLPRHLLSIVNQEAAKDFTAVGIEASVENEALKVRLSIMYKDLSPHKEVGIFTLAVGSSLRPIELLQFGIEPFEIKAISNKPVVLKPEEYPRIQNLTNSLEVVEVEKSIDSYRFSFKNFSNKKIFAYEIWSGNGGSGSSGLGLGEIIEEINFSASEIEKYGLTLKMIIFEDRTYEGDAKSATRYLARWEGEAVQAAKLLPEIVQALNVADEELPEVFVKLEAQLWKMQEAMDKPSALEFLKIKYPAFNEEMISMLYEEFKGGFYSARNSALRPMGQSKQQLQDRGKEFPETDKISMLKRTLTHVKNTLEKIASARN
jgi:hypothetical protein